VSVAVTVGQYRHGAGRLFSVRVVGHEKCKPFRSQLTGSVCRHGTTKLFAADETTPVDDDGKPIFAGVRSCGHNDCVNVCACYRI
jgi:hypothetical protein